MGAWRFPTSMSPLRRMAKNLLPTRRCSLLLHTGRTRWIASCLCCCAVVLPSLAWQSGKPSVSQRLYVEPFATKSGAEKLREDVIAELRKQRTVTLSVELRNPKGETLWSYLATPDADSPDVSKDLARRIAKHVAVALQQGEAPPRTAASPQPAITLKAAGATFPYPVYAKWLTNYRRENPNVEIEYDPIGSEAGVRRLLAGSVDFGASDSPQAIHQIAPDDEGKYLLFPARWSPS